jgi:hypothetical protein
MVQPSFSDPVRAWYAVTPDDLIDLPEGMCRCLYVGGGGDVELVDAEGNTVVFTEVLGGSILPTFTSRVKDGNTTATSILAGY